MKVYIRTCQKRTTKNYTDWKAAVEDRRRALIGATAFDIEGALECHEVQFAQLSGNSPTIVHELSLLKSLQFLDLCGNGIKRLPDMQFWSALPRLHVLFLHQNKLEKVSALSGLAGCTQLRSLTAFDNPVAWSPSYRPFLLSLCPSILCLDDEVKNDKDFLPAGHKLFSRIQSYMDEYSATIVREEQERESLGAAELVASFHRHVHDVHWGYSRCRPYLAIQRVLRGHAGRKQFARVSRRVRPSVVKLQKFLMHRYMRNFALAHFRKRLEAKEEGNFLKWESGRESRERDAREGKSLFVLPSGKQSCLDLLKVWTQLLCIEDAPVVRRTGVACCREPLAAPGGSSSASVRGVVLKRRRRKRDLLEPIKLKADPSILQVIPFNVIRRRGYRSNRKECRVWDEEEESDQEQEQGGRSLTGSPVLHILFNSSDNMRRFCAWVSYFNQNLHKVHATSRSIFLLHPHALDRILAACSIQRVWRSWRCRASMVPTLATSLLRLRSARLLQQWWRWRMLRLRTRLLTEIRRRAGRLSSKTLFIVYPNLKMKLHKCSAAPKLLRESRLRMFFDEEDHVCLHPSEGTGNRLLPAWLGLEEGEGEGEQAAVSLPHDEQSYLQHVKELLQRGCRHHVAARRQGHRWTLDSLPLPRPSLLGKAEVLKLEFASLQEARKRQALLMLHTWRPTAKNDFVCFIELHRARQVLSATLIQATFRGFHARIWFSQLQNFMEVHLGTSIFKEKLLSWKARADQIRPQLSSTSRTARDEQLQASSIYEWAGKRGGGGGGREGEREEEEKEGATYAVMDTRVVMSLQTRNLRLAGLRPATAPLSKRGFMHVQKQNIAATIRYQREISQRESLDAEAARLESKQRRIRSARDRNRISQTLRTQPVELNVNLLQRMHKWEIPNKIFLSERQSASLSARARKAEEAAKQAKRTEEKIQRIQHLEAAQAAQASEMEKKKHRLRSAREGGRREEDRGFSLTFASSMNLVSSHMEKVELERINQARRLQAQQKVAKVKLSNPILPFRARSHVIRTTNSEAETRADQVFSPPSLLSSLPLRTLLPNSSSHTPT